MQIPTNGIRLSCETNKYEPPRPLNKYKGKYVLQLISLPFNSGVRSTKNCLLDNRYYITRMMLNNFSIFVLLGRNQVKNYPKNLTKK